MATRTETPEERVRRRADHLTDLLWHGGTFVIIIAFFWYLDATIGDPAVSWAPWIAVFWGVALAFHALAYYVDGR